MKDQITVYVDIEDSEKLQRVSGFIPASDYKMIVNINPYEYGMVEQENLIIRYRVTGFVKYIKNIFIG